MPSSSNFSRYPHNRPQQHGYEADQRILRETPPSAQSWNRSRTVYQTPIHKLHQTPLILDPSQPSPTPNSSSSSVVKKLLEAATASTRKRDLLTPSRQIQDPSSTAAAFARTAPRAGFLCKLGTNVPEFKRRFFVLKPSTHLYYFLSPGDTEPRGCIDLEDANVEPIERLPDGRFRFEVALDDRRVLLEARSEDVGKEWMQALQEERLSHTKVRLHELQRNNESTQVKLSDLEHQLQEYRMMETDRDGALEDAANWKHKFEELNESLRLLTQHLRRLPSDEVVYKDGSSSSWAREQHSEPIPVDERHDATHVANSSHREASLLDSIDDGEVPIEELDVPGTHFTALNNAVQQLRESVRLASIEASSAVEDLCVANEKVTALEKRMLKAEKKLCEQWEENCAIRQELKITKQEKKVLVKEIKVSRNKLAPPRMMQGRQFDLDEEIGDVVFNIQEGERLIEELEEHVSSSIALSQQLFAVTPAISEHSGMNGSRNSDVNLSGTGSGVTLRIENTTPHGHNVTSSSPLAPKVLSLFDDDSDNEESSCDDEVDSAGPSCISSVGAELGEGEFGHGNGACSDDESEIDRKHPLLKLDDEYDDEVSQPNLYPASSQSQSTNSVVTDNGQATSRLVCPLADVVDSCGTESKENKGDGQVYHLSFYSRKIGIQFQKVPATKTMKGALTEAMTADLPISGNDGSLKTATELRRIADISRRAKSTPDNRGDRDTLDVATAADAVLVCGFQGFDDTANHSRPKLGARLVAFDGVSVEIGNWTFDSIRKAIQARGRPMTLTFRNDFLTMEQRAILTKAVAEVDCAVPPPRKTIQYKNAAPIARAEPVTLRTESASSHESEHFVNDNATHYEDDDLSVSAASSNNRYYGKSYSSGGNFRSFSEAGASSVISSTLGPLMANLMTGLAAKNEKMGHTSSYLNGGGEAVDNRPEFMDFKAGLL